MRSDLIWSGTILTHHSPISFNLTRVPVSWFSPICLLLKINIYIYILSLNVKLKTLNNLNIGGLLISVTGTKLLIFPQTQTVQEMRTKLALISKFYICHQPESHFHHNSWLEFHDILGFLPPIYFSTIFYVEFNQNLIVKNDVV